MPVSLAQTLCKRYSQVSEPSILTGDQDITTVVKRPTQFVIMTYADGDYLEEQQLFCRINEGIADSLLSYGPADIPEPYRPFYALLTKLPHPFKDSWYMSKAAKTAYYFWKPVLINHTLQNTDEGDIVIYADVKSRILRRSIKQDIARILDENDRSATPKCPMILAQNGWLLELVCLPIMFKLMDLDDVRFRHAFQWSAHVVISKNTEMVRQLVLRWINNMMIGNGRILTDDSLPHPAPSPYQGAYQHSCNDQSILNLTLLKERLTPIHCDLLVAWYPNVKDKYALPSQ